MSSHSRGFTVPPPMKAGTTVDSIPRTVSWRDMHGHTRQGQVWSLAPKGPWDSSAYWVAPLETHPHDSTMNSGLIRLVKSNGRYHQ